MLMILKCLPFRIQNKDAYGLGEVEKQSQTQSFFAEKICVGGNENILDEAIFIDGGEIVMQGEADELREKEKGSIDEIFRRKFYVK